VGFETKTGQAVKAAKQEREIHQWREEEMPLIIYTLQLLLRRRNVTFEDPGASREVCGISVMVSPWLASSNQQLPAREGLEVWGNTVSLHICRDHLLKTAWIDMVDHCMRRNAKERMPVHTRPVVMSN